MFQSLFVPGIVLSFNTLHSLKRYTVVVAYFADEDIVSVNLLMVCHHD